MTIERGGIIIYFIFSSFVGFSQLGFSGEATARGLVSSEEMLPFWFYSNQRGRVNNSANVALWLTARENWLINRDFNIEIGGGVLYQDTAENQVDLDELYVQYKNYWLRVIGGIKHYDELYEGLSGTNGNMLWSLNARLMPGFQINTLRPIYFLFNNRLGFSGTWSEFLIGKERFVKNTRLHKKSLYLNYRSKNGLKIALGLEHFVQWAGDSPDTIIGRQPGGLKDYLKIITGQGGSENAFEGEQSNALGNHLGSYELRITQKFKNAELEFMYSHPFEDGSGMLYYNFEDGRYGLYANLNENEEKQPWVDKLLYEFYYTKNQSHNRTPFKHVWDNYFNNGIYRSGWTYENIIIGLPFFTLNNYGSDYPIIGNNRVIIHHFGANGFLMNRFNYKLLVSYRNNNGHARSKGDFDWVKIPEDDPSGKYKLSHEITSTYLDVNLLNSFLNINLQLGADLSSEDSNLGVGLKFNKTF
ncbi:capsule assembly Wzi family protein [Gillisia marina]|uniref:capsule assembly Wzi family protein n=1 Tax=Gillisia marina TaxID=1167637 RepID=UPI00029A3B3A|nr:capsule assembly Wzi family protein [Gillisia marina]